MAESNAVNCFRKVNRQRKVFPSQPFTRINGLQKFSENGK